MPQLGKTHYKYTPEGIAAYRRAKKKKSKNENTMNDIYNRTFGLLEFKAQDPVTSTPTLGGVAKKGISLTSKGKIKPDVKQPPSAPRAGAAPPTARAVPGDITQGFTPKHTETKPEPTDTIRPVTHKDQLRYKDTPHGRAMGFHGADTYQGMKTQGRVIRTGAEIAATELGAGAIGAAVRGMRGSSAAAQGLRGGSDAATSVNLGRYGDVGRRQAGFGIAPGAAKPKFVGSPVGAGADAGLEVAKKAVADPMKTLAGASNAANVSTKTKVVAGTLAAGVAAGGANKVLTPPSGEVKTSTRSNKADAPSDKPSDIGATKPSADPAPARPMRMTQRPHVTSVADAPQLGHTGGKGHTMTSTTPEKVTSVADKPKLSVKPASPERQTDKPVQAPEGDLGTPKPKLSVKPASPERQRSKPVQAPEGDMGTPKPKLQLKPASPERQRSKPVQAPEGDMGTQTKTEPLPELQPIQKQQQKKVRTRLMPRTITGTQTRTGTQTSPQASTQASTETATAPATEPRPSPQRSRPPERIAQGQGSGRPPEERKRKDPKPKRGRKWPILPFLAALGSGGQKDDDGSGEMGEPKLPRPRFPHGDDLEGAGPVGRRPSEKARTAARSSSSSVRRVRSSAGRRRLAAHTIYPKMAKLFS